MALESAGLGLWEYEPQADTVHLRGLARAGVGGRPSGGQGLADVRERLAELLRGAGAEAAG